MLLSCFQALAKFYLFSTENHSLLGPDGRCFCCCLPHKLKMMVLFFLLEANYTRTEYFLGSSLLDKSPQIKIPCQISALEGQYQINPL